MKANIPELGRPRVVIVGGGFAGLEIAKGLKDTDYQVVMIDRNNYHTFIPLLYQVATAGLEPSSIAYPIRKIFKKQKNFHFRVTEMQGVKPYEQNIVTDIGRIDYDYLVLAHGSRANFFGNEEVKKNCLGLKSVNQSLNLRSFILRNFEQSLLTSDPQQQEALMNFVIVGGGPTGVELAGALGELKNKVLPKDYPELDLNKMNIVLMEGMDRLLPGMSQKSSQKAEKYIREFDVDLYKNTFVQNFDSERVTFKKNGEEQSLPAYTLIWAAGVKGRETEGLSEEAFGQGNRVLVDRHNKVLGYENIYAIGDVALMETPNYPDGHPQLAPVAIQQGTMLARNFKAKRRSQPETNFEYHHKGAMATIGRNRAVADLPRIHLAGILAWLAWMLVHLLMLVGFRNKVVVFLDWVWNYFSYDRGIRLILPRSKDLK